MKAFKGAKSVKEHHINYISPVSLQTLCGSDMSNTSIGDCLRGKRRIGHYRNVRGLGKSMIVFRLFEKLRYSNERSTLF